MPHRKGNHRPAVRGERGPQAPSKAGSERFAGGNTQAPAAVLGSGTPTDKVTRHTALPPPRSRYRPGSEGGTWTTSARRWRSAPQGAGDAGPGAEDAPAPPQHSRSDPGGSRAPEGPALTSLGCSGPRAASLLVSRSVLPRPASPQAPAHGATGTRGRETAARWQMRRSVAAQARGWGLGRPEGGWGPVPGPPTTRKVTDSPRCRIWRKSRKAA